MSGSGVRALIRSTRQLKAPRGVVYVPLSQNTAAFLRDSLFIWAAHLCGWKVAGHLRGSDFRASFSSRGGRYGHGCVGPSARGLGRRHGRDASVGLPRSRSSRSHCGRPKRDTGAPADSHVESDPNHVLFLSNLRRRKGIQEAVEAALLVRAQRPAARFTFAGDWESAALERYILARTASGNGGIVFRSPVHGRDKDALLASASVFLFPPVEPEGHPRVVIEALAAGVPVVTTDRGAIRETVVDGESGFVLKSHDQSCSPNASSLSSKIRPCATRSPMPRGGATTSASRRIVRTKHWLSGW